ncbi:D-alanyl-D-alanine-carboxypeptidase/endopeptidase AmpH [Cronobacter dublinensis]|uniref:D-alanyl-D-alanine-carboxypeptidase/endopeptidase AmpH n=1 Tax=Cronobacter dublinensis TaxID=413497 RepID=A0A9Q4T233_9ENTR|nr:D-alanyl-D-alanine-carboxypeptidase/endopeptidase AmpH [Cronobacter dublinensis]EGT5661674.1 D-alanyl-D-alanine-carboxypeptidase/endopeptidase AmpH [Cronobacter dublinensis subsp. dublinensis]EGT4359508.1 D-alanyl-D-alanine-carboxypeptidase/endopeptidase AmpH [Cronobacter dublinensis]EGT4380264.1 D-alanyl-D-alanine-carboxypeptidase/endopeptidase AmpH [Cronobacter dublinensis]EGT5670143.1 D-alanyl-D-alanine-carboxypeptidase/endopeptidase AmpH [Cronobacter dublinensis subsp. dublinensis]EGT56
MKRCLLSCALLISAAFPAAQAAQTSPDPVFASDIVDRYANHIFYGSGATGMAIVVIDGNQRVFRSFGETRPGNNVRPQLDSVIRIASLTKLMTSEMLVKMLDQGVVKLDDPLSRYAPPGARVPTYQGEPIRLVNLATHTSALPREQPGGAAKRPVFVWPTRQQRWEWLSTATLKAAPGATAAYSNLAFDLLADALANAAGKPYTQLFEEQITRPLGMKDTTFTPSPDQCKRLMVAEKGASPCNNTLAAIGSGGVYSTPDDMMRWMQQFLASDFHRRSAQADRMQTLIYQRTQLTRVVGMDVPGKADALGLGWVYMAPKDGRPGIIQKTGGGGGFITYMAMVPQSNIGAFVVVTRSPLTRFTNMSDGINDLVTELSGNKPLSTPES